MSRRFRPLTPAELEQAAWGAFLADSPDVPSAWDKWITSFPRLPGGNPAAEESDPAVRMTVSPVSVWLFLAIPVAWVCAWGLAQLRHLVPPGLRLAKRAWKALTVVKPEADGHDPVFFLAAPVAEAGPVTGPPWEDEPEPERTDPSMVFVPWAAPAQRRPRPPEDSWRNP